MIECPEHLRSVHRDSGRLGDRSRYVRLDRNERVTPFPPQAFQEMLACLKPETFTSYPDTTPLTLVLAGTWGSPKPTSS